MLNTGFTLIELMMVIVVMAVLIGATMPAMGNFINQIRLSNDVNEFIAATMLARSEAIKRGEAVTLCRSKGVEAGLNQCDTGGDDWSSGWLMYLGVKGDIPDPASGSRHAILLRQGALNTGIHMIPSATATTITYNANGVPWPTPPEYFKFSWNQRFSRLLCFSPSGRTMVLPVDSTKPCPS